MLSGLEHLDIDKSFLLIDYAPSSISPDQKQYDNPPTDLEVSRSDESGEDLAAIKSNTSWLGAFVVQLSGWLLSNSIYFASTPKTVFEEKDLEDDDEQSK